jgi:DNA-binding transcriptional ArsR family regulator
VRFNIYSMLEVFGELSLTNLAEKLHKSKSTIHEHLKRLIETGLISAPIKKPSHLKKNVYENYYKLSENYVEILSHIDDQTNLDTPMTKKKAKNVIQMGKSMVKLFISFLEKKFSFLHEMEKSMEKEPDQIVNLINEMNHIKTDDIGDVLKDSNGENLFHSENFNSFNFYNSYQLDYMREKLFKLYKDLESDEYFIGLGNKEKARGSLVITTVIPLKRIIEI